MGIGPAAMQAVNPRLIYCSITGFGQDGPYAHRAGYDLLVQGMGGIMDITGPEHGAPYKVGAAIGDLVSGDRRVVGAVSDQRPGTVSSVTRTCARCALSCGLF